MKQTQLRPGPTPDQRYVRSVLHMMPFSRMVGIPASEDDFSTPTTIRTIWAVPIDDTHTWNMELAQVDPAWGMTPEEIGRAGFGQSDDRPYEARQRHPADYDAQSSQRAIAVHALEHLASTDRGVIMLRKIIRDGIRAVAAGGDPKELLRESRPPIATACQDRVLRIPPEKYAETDKLLLRETGRKVARGG
jgi:hypothetical protein